jgi:DmsE family decaheme c-type cytochrome
MNKILLPLICLLILAGTIALAAAEGDKPADPRLALTEEGGEYIGTTQCLMCHTDMKDPYLGTKHALSLGNAELPPSVVGCEMCHGPGSLHMGSFTNDPGQRAIVNFKSDLKATFTAICLDCHSNISTKFEYANNTHAESNVFCVKCHNPHANDNRFALLRKPVNELCASCHQGVMGAFKSGLAAHPVKKDAFFCTDCHNPHGSNPSLLIKDSVSATCGGCHEYTRQAYAFPHVSEYTDPAGKTCLNCHSPHATAVPNLLLFQGRTLCLRCHSDKVAHNPSRTCWTSGCHSQIHGSNDNPQFVK